MTLPAKTSSTFPSKYTLRRKVLTLVGAQFHARTESDRLIAFTQLKGFKLKEDIRVYADEAKTKELLVIQARQILDISATYDVTDPNQGGMKIGALQRKGVKSIVRDEWLLLDAADNEIGLIQEESMFVALLRRFIEHIPQSFHVKIGETILGRVHQNFNPFVLKLSVDFTEDKRKQVDPRMGFAIAILLAAIEGRQG